MENEFRASVFDRAVKTAVFVGIVTTILTMFYDLIFVQTFKFPFSEIINVASLIFGVNLLFLIIGFIYYAFIKAFKKGNIFFSALIILLTIFFAWKAEGVFRTDNYAFNMEFRHLLSGIIVIMGIAAALAIPFLFNNKSFEKHVV